MTPVATYTGNAMGVNLVRGIFSILGARIGTITLYVVLTPIIVRYLGPRYGDYAFVMSVLAIVLIVVEQGIFSGLRKFISEDRPVPGWQNHVFGFYFRVGVLSGVLAIVVILASVATGVVQTGLSERFVGYFYLLSVLVVLRQLFEIGRSGLMGFGREHYSEPLLPIHKLVFGVVGLSLLALGWGITGLLVGDIVASILVVTVAFVFIRDDLSLATVFEPTPRAFPRGELLSFNALVVVLSLLLETLYHVDILMLRPLAGSQQTAYYKGALLMTELLWIAPIALQTALVHSTSELWARDSRERIHSIAARVTRYTLLSLSLLVVGIAVLGDVFVPLYFGADFAPAVTPMWLLLPGTLGLALTLPIIAIGEGKGEIRVLIAATGGAAVINLALNSLLIPTYGMNGAAVATSTAYGSMLFFHVRGARRIGFDPLADLRGGPIAASALGTAAVLFAVRAALPSDLLALLVGPPVGLACYALLARTTGAVDAAEVEDAVDFASRSIKRVVRHVERA